MDSGKILLKKVKNFLYEKAIYLWENREEIVGKIEEKGIQTREKMENKLDSYYSEYEVMELSRLEKEYTRIKQHKIDNPRYELTIKEKVAVKIAKERGVV